MSLILSEVMDLGDVEFTKEEVEMGAKILYGERMSLEEAERLLDEMIDDNFIRKAINNCPICSKIAKDLNAGGG